MKFLALLFLVSSAVLSASQGSQEPRTTFSQAELIAANSLAHTRDIEFMQALETSSEAYDRVYKEVYERMMAEVNQAPSTSQQATTNNAE